MKIKVEMSYRDYRELTKLLAEIRENVEDVKRLSITEQTEIKAKIALKKLDAVDDIIFAG